MVNESDEKYEGHEEGEYHFSDDQLNYEVDTETQKVSEAAAAVTVKQSPMEMLSKYRRILIAGVVFFVLMFIVYKMLSPVNTVPTTEFSQQTTTTTTKTTTKPAAQVAKAPQAPQTMPASAAMQTVAQNQLPPQQQTTAPSQATMQANQMVPPANMPNAVQGQMNQQPQTMAMQQASQAGNMQMQQSPSSVSDANQNINDRVAQLEQANAKLANVLQIEYAQKMTDFQNQSAATQARLQELNKRVANMEAALSQITQLLQDSGKQVSVPTSGVPSAKAASPKQLYTVQAIIPGRAWLKSDAGDTVTVAEGDVLKDYGRVTKIDPYDGVVDIDTGNKMVSLSYGAGTD